MSFDDRSLRKGYSPKNNVLKKYSNVLCNKIDNIYFIVLDDKVVCSERSSFEAWRDAESVLL